METPDYSNSRASLAESTASETEAGKVQPSETAPSGESAGNCAELRGNQEPARNLDAEREQGTERDQVSETEVQAEQEEAETVPKSRGSMDFLEQMSDSSWMDSVRVPAGGFDPSDDPAVRAAHCPVDPLEKSASDLAKKHYFSLDALIGRALFSGTARFLSGATSSWYSQPDTCQRVYFANHTSHLDMLVIWSALPDYVRRLTRPVAAKDYWSKGLLKPYIANRLFNAILLERQNIKAHRNPIDSMLHEMGDVYSIIIFPEGGRQSSGQIEGFKSGLYYMCKKRPQLELIPIYIENMNRILPRGTYLPVPLLSHVTFGPPMWLEQDEKKQDFLDRARQAILDLKTGKVKESLKGNSEAL